jgi:hypothetical protein
MQLRRGRGVMATEAIDCTEARRQAIQEAFKAIVDLEIGDPLAAINHLRCAESWCREIV